MLISLIPDPEVYGLGIKPPADRGQEARCQGLGDEAPDVGVFC